MSDIYLGNPNLKKANTQQSFTEEHVKEFLKCKADPVYFTEKHIKIVNVDEGLVSFNMYKFQKKLLKNLEKNKFINGEEVILINPLTVKVLRMLSEE